MRPAKTERFLRCHFTDPELLAISKSMSQAVATRAQTENDKKRMAKEFDARIASLDAEIDLASEKVRSGYECRNIACSITYNSPRIGMKEVWRDDTGELVEVLQMQASEMQEELPLDGKKPEAEPAAQPQEHTTPRPGEVIDAEIPPPPAPEPEPEAANGDQAEILASGDLKGDLLTGNLTTATASTLRLALEMSGGTGKRGKLLRAQLDAIEAHKTPEA
jgi:hypothetical protein